MSFLAEDYVDKILNKGFFGDIRIKESLYYSYSNTLNYLLNRFNYFKKTINLTGINPEYKEICEQHMFGLGVIITDLNDKIKSVKLDNAPIGFYVCHDGISTCNYHSIDNKKKDKIHLCNVTHDDFILNHD